MVFTHPTFLVFVHKSIADFLPIFIALQLRLLMLQCSIAMAIPSVWMSVCLSRADLSSNEVGLQV